MAISLENLFFNLVYLFDLFVVLQILYLYIKKRRIGKQVGLLGVYCIFNSLSNYIGGYTTSDLVDFYIYGLFTLVEYGVFAFFIAQNLQRRGFKHIMLYASIFFFVFTIYHTLTASPTGLDSIPIAIETILIFLYCFYYLYIQMNVNENEVVFIYSKYQFWIIVGFMVYLGGSFFIYILANIVSHKILVEYWFLTYVFYILKNILFAIGISLLPKQPNKHQYGNVYSFQN